MDTSPTERLDAHSHIRGLGLDDALQPRTASQGLVGQLRARRAAGVLLRMTKEGRVSGRGLLLAGPPGTGKTAVALGLARALGDAAPFTALSAAELCSLALSKSEALTQALRRSVAVRVREEAELVEGEVVAFELERGAAAAPGRRARLTLKTTDMESVYELGEKLVDALLRERVAPGDVVSVDRASGRVTRLGRSLARAADFDAAGARLAPCPEGEILRRREVVHVVTLHDVDVVNSRAEGFLALFSGETGEIGAEVRAQVDARVAEWVEQGRAELAPGVLFIDEAHMLDLESCSYLNRALEGPAAPLLVLATNRGVTRVRGTEHCAPHGLPLDLLDRLAIVHTEPHTAEQLGQILALRCTEEDVEMGEEARALLAAIAAQTSLRYAIQLIALSNICAQRRKAAAVEVEDLRSVFSLFVDAGRSAAFLNEQNDGYLFNEDNRE